MVGAPLRRQAVRHLMRHYSVSECRACQLIRLARTVYRYQFRRPSQQGLRSRIRELATARVRYGYKRIHILLKRDGIHVNKKRVHRLYFLEGLQIRPRRARRRVSASHRICEQSTARAPDEAWAMDFVADQLLDGMRIRILTVVDTITRECLAATVGYRLKSGDVVATLTRIVKERGKPQRILSDNGSEFSGQMTDLWAYSNKVVLSLSRPSKPTDNAFIESFNASLRDECLNCIGLNRWQMLDRGMAEGI